MPTRLLLGPQRPLVNLGQALAGLQLGDGPVGFISAGWQEAEGDLAEAREVVGRPLVDPRLYHRAEEVFAADPELLAAHRQRQDRLKEQQRIYRLRLRQLMIAARLTLTAEGDREVLAAERRHAVAQLRALDRHHVQRVRAVHAAFEKRLRPLERDSVASQREAIAAALDLCETVLIAGGHVAILLNRIRLFGLEPLLAEKHLVAWSAGAMVLSDHVVLFHDRLAQGRRDPEMLDAGAGFCPGMVLLPDAARRLRESDRVRLELYGRRFAPADCITLDSGALLAFEGGRWVDSEATRRIGRGGRLRRASAP